MDGVSTADFFAVMQQVGQRMQEIEAGSEEAAEGSTSLISIINRTHKVTHQSIDGKKRKRRGESQEDL